MIEDCKSEVIRLHEFFEQWLKGEIENTEDNFKQFTSVIGKEFLLIAPTGEKISRKDIIKRIKNDYGKHIDEGSRYRLFVKNIRCRVLEGNLCLVLYEEWANLKDKVISRMSSALFRKKEDTPNSVEWTHVHETLFPND